MVRALRMLVLGLAMIMTWCGWRLLRCVSEVVLVSMVRLGMLEVLGFRLLRD